MARVVDPVCGMQVDTDRAAVTMKQGGQDYYFCSEQCATAFRSAPERYVGAGPANAKPEQHEPPYTTKGGMTAPKFGAAGSGGAEYERLPERHDNR